MIPAENLRKQLLPFGAGAPSAELVLLNDNAAPEHHIRYLDLIRRAQNDRDSLWPEAVIEIDGRPTVYVVGVQRPLSDKDPSLAHLRRRLAFRAGADYVALSVPGRLTVYPVAPVSTGPLPAKSARENDSNAPALIPSLAYPSTDDDWTRAVSISASLHQVLYELLTRSIQTIVNCEADPLDALSLVGRALFVRFLADRRVLAEDQIKAVCGASIPECFSDAKRAFQTSAWLDHTFNGDFLPLSDQGSEAFFQRLPQAVFFELSNILHRATSTGQLHLSWGSHWDDLWFDHIPVGLISQVYENHAHSSDAPGAKATSIYYTPGHIAEYMVDEVFFALGNEKAKKARVLDPAAGGGVFLVAAFRRLAAEYWKANGKPADTKALREILYGQLQGFDIQPSALRLCSLALYLTAIELDPDPRPAHKLRFEKALSGHVLHDVRSKDQKHVYLGSLDPERVGAEHHGQYDVVIGNPPWTGWKVGSGVAENDLKAQKRIVETEITAFARERLDDPELCYEMTDKNPDLPFLWRSMQWAKPSGWIALTLHGRLLFKQSEPGKRDRKQIFRALYVTGIFNGAALRQTEYWPTVDAPFCLLFARNEKPPKDAAFWYISPELEKGLNDRGKLRIDDTSARPVAVDELIQKPWLLKALFRGSELDVQVVEAIERSSPDTVYGYWKRQGSTEDDGRVPHYGQGYKIGGKSRAHKPAADLWGMPDLNRHAGIGYRINVGELPRVPHGKTMQYPRAQDIYRAPLVVIAEAPSPDRGSPNACISLDDIAYNESFTGISCMAHAEPELLAHYLLLLFNSCLAAYLWCMKSSRFAIERDVLRGEDISGFRFIPLEKVPEEMKKEIPRLAQGLIEHGAKALPKVDRWAAAVYGLSSVDMDVIHDTLAVSLPFASSKTRAQKPPTPEEVKIYIERLQKTLNPLLKRRKRTVSIEVLRREPAEPWILLQLDSHPEDQPPPPLHKEDALVRLIQEADSLSAASLFAVYAPSTLCLGIVAQYRWFTPTRARMLGLDILQEHEDVLLGRSNGG